MGLQRRPRHPDADSMGWPEFEVDRKLFSVSQVYNLVDG
jgi:hypothetical protein